MQYGKRNVCEHVLSKMTETAENVCYTYIIFDYLLKIKNIYLYLIPVIILPSLD